MNKQLIKQNLEELKKQTLLSILSAKGVIWTYYKNKLLDEIISIINKEVDIDDYVQDVSDHWKYKPQANERKKCQ